MLLLYSNQTIPIYDKIIGQLYLKKKIVIVKDNEKH